MKQKTRKRHITIECETAAGFDKELSHVLSKAGRSVQIMHNMNRTAHCAYVMWEEVENVPENIRDEYELKGVSFRCADCPFYERPADRRLRDGSCKLKARTDPNGAACLHFYKLYALGELEPVER